MLYFNSTKGDIMSKKVQKKKKKKYFIYLSKVYKLTTVTLLVCILVLGLFYKNVNGQNKCEEVKIVKKEIVNPNIVFLGDSITDFYDLNKYYPDIKKVNSGISGNRTQDILSNMNDRVYRYNPSKVVLLIGINNILHETNSDHIIEDIEKITNQIKENLPNCEIYIQSIYPINEDCEKNFGIISDYKSLNNKIIEDNKKIKDLCNKKGYTYIDMFFMLENNKFFDKVYTDDGLHPNENGYKTITNVLKKYL